MMGSTVLPQMNLWRSHPRSTGSSSPKAELVSHASWWIEIFRRADPARTKVILFTLSS